MNVIELNKYLLSHYLEKLNLDHLDDVLMYISKHPDAPDSKVKSNFIFCFLKNREDMLSGTLKLSGKNQNRPDSYSEIVRWLRNDKDHWTMWNGKWLFDKSGKLVAQEEITRYDLDQNFYGEVDPD